MNKLYIDLYSKNDEIKNITSDNKFSTFFKKLHYNLKNIFRNYRKTKYEDSISLLVDIDYINSVCLRQNRKYSLEEKFILKFIKSNFSCDDKVNTVKIIFSKKLYNMNNNKKYILNFLNNIYNIKFTTVEYENQILEHDLNIIDRYINSKKIEKEKLKILVIISNIMNLNKEKLIEYINSYKQVDLFVTSKLSKKEIKLIQDEVDSINNEYGSSIDVLQSEKETKKYNVYLNYSNVNKEKFISNHLVNKKAKFIDINNIDEDILSDGYRLFVKNEKLIKEMLINLNLNLDNFSIVNLGTSQK